MKTAERTVSAGRRDLSPTELRAKEALIADLFDNPENVSAVARRHGICRHVAMDIIWGRKYAWILPDIERFDPACINHACTGCVHYTARGRGNCHCDLGFSESIDNIRFARFCAAYMEAKQ